MDLYFFFDLKTHTHQFIPLNYDNLNISVYTVVILILNCFILSDFSDVLIYFSYFEFYHNSVPFDVD